MKAPSLAINGVPTHGGEITPGDSLSILNTNGSGTIYYTLDGSDPRLPYFVDGNNGPQGEVAPDALAYDGAVTLSGTTVVNARILDGSTWSARVEAVYAPTSVQDAIRITEIMYHPLDAPAGNPDAEFIEIQNISDIAIDLDQLQFTDGVAFSFPSMTLEAGAYAVVVADVAAFESIYGTGINVVGAYTGRLNNAGERIVLEDALGNEIHRFRYRDSWFDVTDGLGHTLTIVDTSLDALTAWSEKSSWMASSISGGTPGTGDDGNVPLADAIIINEVLAHSHDSDPDWIELYNTSEAAIDVSGWYLSDDADVLQKYVLPAETIVPALGYLVVYEDVHFGNNDNPDALIPFALSSNGESVYLSSGADGALTGYRTEESFGASPRDVAFGIYVTSDGGDKFVAMSENTPGAANAMPLLGDVIMTEIMYDPASNDQNGEYIELYNTTASTIVLGPETGASWRFTNGVEYNFPVGATISAFGRVIVARDPDTFNGLYTVSSGVGVYGPYGGRLSDGEGLELSRPAELEEGQGQFFIRTDHVKYDSNEPWPTTPNGQGDALHRVSTSAFGNEPASWTGAPASPGE
jgi:hypothetical protein